MPKKSLRKRAVAIENHFESTVGKKFFGAKSGRNQQKRPPNLTETTDKMTENRNFEKSVVYDKRNVILIKRQNTDK